jgi:hypothetical protein
MKIEGCVRKKFGTRHDAGIFPSGDLTEDSKFQATIDFVRSYLDNVVQQASPFGDKEQNKLTFEVNILLKVT